MPFQFKNINYHQFDRIQSITFDNDSVCFMGVGHDDREDAILKFVQEKKLKSYTISYNPNEFNVTGYNNSPCKYYDFVKSISMMDSVNTLIIESTTLNFVEILYILTGAYKNKNIKRIKILYLEPLDYKQKKLPSQIINHEFELSQELHTFPPIPGFSILSNEQEKMTLLAFLGFEKNRLGQIFNYDEGLSYDNFIPIVPIPGYKLGWENRTIKSHLDYLNVANSFTKLEFLPADNPYSSYIFLKKMSQLQKKMRIAPIGTKPSAIGCAIFLAEREIKIDHQIGVLYDFPVKLKKRSQGVGKIFEYNLFKTN